METLHRPFCRSLNRLNNEFLYSLIFLLSFLPRAIQTKELVQKCYNMVWRVFSDHTICFHKSTLKHCYELCPQLYHSKSDWPCFNFIPAPICYGITPEFVPVGFRPILHWAFSVEGATYFYLGLFRSKWYCNVTLFYSCVCEPCVLACCAIRVWV